MMAYKKSLAKDAPLVKVAADDSASKREPFPGGWDSLKHMGELYPQIKENYNILQKGQYGDVVLNGERLNKPEFKTGLSQLADKFKANVSAAPSVKMVDDLIAAFEAYKNADNAASGSAPQTSLPDAPSVAPKTRGRKKAEDFVSRFLRAQIADFDPTQGQPGGASSVSTPPPGMTPPSSSIPSAASASSLSPSDKKIIDGIIAKLKEARSLMINYEIDVIDGAYQNLMSHEFDGKTLEDVMWPALGHAAPIENFEIASVLFGVPFVPAVPAEPADTKEYGPSGRPARPEQPAIPGVLQLMDSPSLKQHMKIVAADGKVDDAIHSKAIQLEEKLKKMAINFPRPQKDPKKGAEWARAATFNKTILNTTDFKKDFDNLEKLLGRKDAGTFWVNEEFGTSNLSREFVGQVGELIESLGPAQQKSYGNYTAKIDNAGKVFVNDKPLTETKANEIKTHFKDLCEALVNTDPSKNAANVQALRFIQTSDPMNDCGQAIVLKMVEKFTKDFNAKTFKPKTLREIESGLKKEYPRALQGLFLEIIRTGEEFKAERISITSPIKIEGNNTINIVVKNGVDFSTLTFNGKRHEMIHLIRALKDSNVRKSDFDDLLQRDTYAAGLMAYKACLRLLLKEEFETSKEVAADHSKSQFAGSQFFCEIEDSIHVNSKMISRLLRLAGIKAVAQEGTGKLTMQRELENAKKLRESLQKRLDAVSKDPNQKEDTKNSTIERVQSQIAQLTQQIVDYESEIQSSIDEVSGVTQASRWTEGYDMPSEVLAAIADKDAKPVSVNMMMNVVIDAASFGGSAANIVTGPTPFTSTKSFPGKGDDFGIVFHNYDSKTKTILGTDFTGARKKLLIEDVTKFLDGPKENITEEKLLQIRQQVLTTQPVSPKKKLKPGERLDSASIIRDAKEHLEVPLEQIIASQDISRLRIEQLSLQKLNKNLNTATAPFSAKTPEQAEEMTGLMAEIGARSTKIASEIKTLMGEDSGSEASAAFFRALRVEQRIYDKFGEMGLVRQLLELDEDKEENIERAEKNLAAFDNVKDYIESNRPEFIKALEKAKSLLAEEKTSKRGHRLGEEFV
jgi:hypothetical protein